MWGRLRKGYKGWEEGPDDARITIQQVIEMREHLRTAVGLAKANLGQAQAGQKRRYDQRAVSYTHLTLPTKA